MKTWKTLHLIRSEHLNHHGGLYAGQALEWLAESAFITMEMFYGERAGIVYKNAHKFDFMKQVPPGAIISYESVVVRTGSSSVTTHTEVRDEDSGELIADGFITFVTIDPETKRSVKHGLTLDETDDEQQLAWREEVKKYFK